MGQRAKWRFGLLAGDEMLQRRLAGSTPPLYERLYIPNDASSAAMYMAASDRSVKGHVTSILITASFVRCSLTLAAVTLYAEHELLIRIRT